MKPGLVSKRLLPKPETVTKWHVQYGDLFGTHGHSTHDTERPARAEAKRLNTGPAARFFVSVVKVTTTRTTLLATTRADSL